MTIGLIRHFKVDAPRYKHQMTSEEFSETQRYYDSAKVFKHPVDLGNIDWQICYASTLKRAQETARDIYNGEIKSSDLIIEVNAYPVFNTQKKFSFSFWVIMARLAWVFGFKSQKESRRDTIRRCTEFYNEIILSDHEHVLVVSHGFFLREFVKFLKRQGYKGQMDYIPKNANLYTFYN